MAVDIIGGWFSKEDCLGDVPYKELNESIAISCVERNGVFDLLPNCVCDQSVSMRDITEETDTATAYLDVMMHAFWALYVRSLYLNLALRVFVAIGAFLALLSLITARFIKMDDLFGM